MEDVDIYHLRYSSKKRVGSSKWYLFKDMEMGTDSESMIPYGDTRIALVSYSKRGIELIGLKAFMCCHKLQMWILMVDGKKKLGFFDDAYSPFEEVEDIEPFKVRRCIAASDLTLTSCQDVYLLYCIEDETVISLSYTPNDERKNYICSKKFRDRWYVEDSDLGFTREDFMRMLTTAFDTDDESSPILRDSLEQLIITFLGSENAKTAFYTHAITSRFEKIIKLVDYD